MRFLHRVLSAVTFGAALALSASLAVAPGVRPDAAPVRAAPVREVVRRPEVPPEAFADQAPLWDEAARVRRLGRWGRDGLESLEDQWRRAEARAEELVAAVAPPVLAPLTAAVLDARRLPPDVTQHTLYLDTSAWPEAKRADRLKVLAFHCNSLSRNADFGTIYLLTPTLVRLDIRDYKWSKELVGKLAALDPYYHVKLRDADFVFEEVTREKIIQHPGGPYEHPDGRKFANLAAGPYTIEWREKARKDRKPSTKEETKSAPWLDTKAITELITLTKSQVPIVRADWFIVQTARELDREEVKTGAGYYAFLGIKSRDDILNLSGLDEKVARRIQREVAAVIKDSGVAVNSRGIIRKGAQAGGVWFSLDVAGAKERKNPLRFLNGDFAHEAEEVYFTLPNRLFGLAAVNAGDGTLQDFVPEKFAGDKRTSNNDFRVHPGLSCIRCHVEGLRPLRDYVREFYSDGTFLTEPEYDKYKRLKALYLQPLEDDYEADQLVYAKAVFRLTGWTPRKLAEEYAATWSEYVDRTVTGEQLALELGVSHAEMVKAFVAAHQAQGKIDPIVGAYIRGKVNLVGISVSLEIPQRRDHVEELFPLMATYAKGFLP